MLVEKVRPVPGSPDSDKFLSFVRVATFDRVVVGLEGGISFRALLVVMTFPQRFHL